MVGARPGAKPLSDWHGHWHPAVTVTVPGPRGIITVMILVGRARAAASCQCYSPRPGPAPTTGVVDGPSRVMDVRLIMISILQAATFPS